jgi:transcriptional regulator with XRE-family HTH domain
MMKGKKPTPEEEDARRRLGRKLAVLRAALNKTQSRLARDSKVKRASISQYEADQTTPDASTLGRLLTSMGFQWSALDLAEWFLARLFSECTLAEGKTYQTPNAEELEAMAANMTDMAARLTSMARTLRDRARDLPESTEKNQTPTIENRTAARQFFAQIRGLSRQKQEERLRKAPAEIRWALCELLCLESQRVCPDDPKQAASLAEFALELADLALGIEAWRAKLRGLAWAHIGNALRARGEDLPAAESAFASAEESWRAGGEAHRGLLEEGLVFALKASLRRAQRRFEEAADLLDRASAVATGTRFRVQVLISRAKLAEELGELDRAVAILCEAGQMPVIDDDVRLTLCVQHNLADNLSKLDRFTEADGLLPAVRELSRKCGGEIDAVRLLWTEGRVAAGLGRIEEGIEALAKVRGGFASRGMGFDTALVSLELSLLHLRQGRTEPVKNLARHMTPIFKAQDVHREALAALTVFRRAAEREQVTEEFAREVLSYLRKARYNPELRFELDTVACKT